MVLVCVYFLWMVILVLVLPMILFLWTCLPIISSSYIHVFLWKGVAPKILCSDSRNILKILLTIDLILKILPMLTIDDPLGSGACLSALPWQLNQLQGGTLPWKSIKNKTCLKLWWNTESTMAKYSSVKYSPAKASRIKFVWNNYGIQHQQNQIQFEQWKNFTNCEMFPA